jgi:large subunit ribosomal protein L27e
LKPGKVALITRGRYAGRKAVILKPFDDGTKSHPYGHALVAGIQRYPGKITSRMGKKRIAKRSKVKPFLKAINYNHLMPTRYALEGIEQLKTQIGSENLKEVSQREEAKKAVKKSFEEKFQVRTSFFASSIFLGGSLTWCSLERKSGSSRLFVSRCACCCGTAFVREFI